ncbi:MAG TPA: SCO family protein, partial [Bacteroidia bacterium]|nr:SCO family protein [Bacteroidia bacterium]
QDQPVRYLPYYGPKYSRQNDDTIYHRVKGFSFVNQFGKATDSNTIQNKIYVTEFFFTTCKSICPIMNSNLDKIYHMFGNRGDFLILSHTVDPEQDSVPVLKAYSDLHGVHNSNWLFVTGPKSELYQQARISYLLNADQGDGGPADFIHTQNFALVDKERHIRGYYDGTDSLDVNRLITDIKLLIKEYEYRNKMAD